MFNNYHFFLLFHFSPLKGLFLSNEFWFDPLLKGKSYDLAVWPLPAIESIKLKTLAHLLTDLPLPVRYRNARVQIKTDSQLNRTENIQHILKHENMCLKNQSEDNDDIYVFVGYEDFLDSAKLFAANKTLIIVPLLSNHFNISGKKLFVVIVILFLMHLYCKYIFIYFRYS